MVTMKLTKGLRISAATQGRNMSRLSTRTRHTSKEDSALTRNGSSHVTVLLPEGLTNEHLRRVSRIILPRKIVLLDIIISRQVPGAGLKAENRSITTKYLPLTRNAISFTRNRLTVRKIGTSLLLNLLSHGLEADKNNSNQHQVINSNGLTDARLRRQLTPSIDNRNMNIRNRRNLPRYNLTGRRQRLSKLTKNGHAKRRHLTTRGITIRRNLNQRTSVLRNNGPALINSNRLTYLNIVDRTGQTSSLTVLDRTQAQLLPKRRRTVSTRITIIKMVTIITAVRVMNGTILNRDDRAIITPFPSGLTLSTVPTVRSLLMLKRTSKTVTRKIAMLTISTQLKRQVLAGIIRLQRAKMRHKGSVSNVNITILLMVSQTAVRLIDLNMRHTSITTVTTLITRQPRGSTNIITLLRRRTLGTISMNQLPYQIINSRNSVTSVLRTITLRVNLNSRRSTVLITRLMGTQIINVIENTRHVSIISLRRLRITTRTVRTRNTTLIVIIVITISTVRLGMDTIRMSVVTLSHRLNGALTVQSMLTSLIAIMSLGHGIVRRKILKVPRINVNRTTLNVTISTLTHDRRILTVTRHGRSTKDTLNRHVRHS